jgi:sulfur carrier protein ThiS
LACSVVTGAPISGWNRYTVAAKSPLTHAFGESEAAGYFGPELKFAGFDAIIIRGQAAKPTYIFIKDGEVHSVQALRGPGGREIPTQPQMRRSRIRDRRGPSNFREVGGTESRVAAIRDAMMTILVFVILFSGLRIDRFAEAEVELPEGATLTDLLDKLQIPLQDVGIVMVNARSGTLQQKLKEDERVTLIPPIGGG